MTDPGQPSSVPRISAIDLARGLALIAMAIYHFTWDLEFFGYVVPGLTANGGWKLFARCIASSFLILAGVSLVLAHANGIRWRGFWRRFAMVAGAAMLISIATYFAVPDAFIFFGILHQIAVASLIGLLFLRSPWFVTLAVAILVIAAPPYLRGETFDQAALWWVGLSTHPIRSNDYVPLFPWFGAVLIGMGIAQLAVKTSLPHRLAAVELGVWSAPLRFAGRHSLAVYLIHQPILIGLVWVASHVIPVPDSVRSARFTQDCETQCLRLRNDEFCNSYCGCVLDRIGKEDMLDAVFTSQPDPATTDKLLEFAAMCTAETESLIEGDPR